jgi:hypothetical protein
MLAALVAAAVAVTPSFAGSFLTGKQASHLFLSSHKAQRLYLKRKTADNLFVAKATAPPPAIGIAAGNTLFGPVTATSPTTVPTAFTSFTTKSTGPVVVTFSGATTCTSAAPTIAQACPVQILVDGQSTGKVNFARATDSTPSPAFLTNTVTQATVLGKGPHTVSVQYSGASGLSFSLKNWNLVAEAFPQPSDK